MVTSEAWPLAKTGGLGDAVGGLAKALRSGGTGVTILMPAWRGTQDQLSGLHRVTQLPHLPGGPGELYAGYCPALGCRVLLLRNDALYDRDSLYVTPEGDEYDDNAVRFAALSMAAARIAQGLPGVTVPAVVHAHDWHAALASVYMHQFGVQDIKTILTLHNVAFQGVYPMMPAEQLGLHPEYLTADGLEYWGKLNFLKAGLLYSDCITVVSHNYAREILTPRFGCGLESLFAARSHKMVAIPNGIDTMLWNAGRDTYLHGKTFTADRLENKVACKTALQKAYGLDADRGAFLLAMGSRLTEQKMVDVALQALPQALDAMPKLQVCILGQGERRAERELVQLAQRYPGRCGVYIGYSEARAHQLHAGADALLHGSRFEPFGLTPLYSMRYGTIPIASRVGGMVDTIVDPGRGAAGFFGATGLLFEGESEHNMLEGIDRAIDLYSMSLIWRTMQRNAMTAPMGWDRCAPQYAHLYQALRPDVALGRVPERVKVSNWGRASALSGTALATHVTSSREGGRLPVRERAATSSANDVVVTTGTSIA